MSRKIERLINLTIALLATKRFLTKQEIFRSVEGYEGSDETKERMFERDKDDLRNLGVSIDVGSFDPVFEDEAGYRIRPEAYALDLGQITGTEIALLSLAAEAWRGAALDGAAHSALNKLRSMGVESDLDALPAIAPRLFTTFDGFQVITHAISKRDRITFAYLSADLEPEVRTIEPYAVGTRNSHWYLAGRDLDREQVRTFRLDRIEGEVAIAKRNTGFEIPEDFDLFASLTSVQKDKIATIDIRKGKAQLLRNSALSLMDKGEWDQITMSYLDAVHLVDLVLWHGEDAIVIAPESLRYETIRALEEIVRING